MKFEDIEVGKVYEVNYVDPNYPCTCPCHSDNAILHCMPCCYDGSYEGRATCCLKDEVQQMVWFVLRQGGRRFLRLEPSSVIEEVEATPIEVDDGEMLWILRGNKYE